MKLSIIIPVFNEEQTVRVLVERVWAVDLGGVEREVIVVDDASADASPAVLRELEAEGLCVVHRHPVNQGKGAAIRTGVSRVTGDMVIIQDADLEYDPGEYPRVMAPLLENRADVVYGSRFLERDQDRLYDRWHAFGNGVLTWVSNRFTGLGLSDMETCYKLFRASVIKAVDIEEPRFGFEPEITAKVAKLGVRVVEVPVSYDGRTYSAGKKIGWRDALWALRCIVKYSLRRD
ncbi:glycosyltransferase family 2 protein [Mucisphaera calidilacus]|uniref:Undecaprenyl-phosphate 4-deoxy-4-formamido-L-arabinose transferase n=1 Tax=Mucisphaera calidilacus TaxID=2527982 RepID=A0A518BUV7_9BACT|nr:glycosyltransferase family 2 protein [Mucisphaera calidilacus]QDU70775.1 Undecaprenyl-phosphate 4-deoxy-4-formamido-L-arabinose transferase [Mucisphaera calidilacus]